MRDGSSADGSGTKSTTITAAAAEAETGGAMRIYIGGLGGNVTADDLKKTFSAPHLGTVTAVDVIRSKGRSFAYLDFIPSSDKGLAKLFSSYNGCMWKGGRLRLEKAKEHYLLRLRREWEENAELATDCGNQDGSPAVKEQSQDKPKKFPNMEKMQLNIFFPRLRKIKPVPFKGTGKHKYSFQRIEVPPLPTHFCDCEEHYVAVDVAKPQQCSNLLNPGKEKPVYNHERDDGVNEEELNMMNSVMNKLFEKENFSTVTCSKAEISGDTDNAMNTIDDTLVAEDHGDQESDEDNLIINVVGGSNNNHCLSGNLPSIDNLDLFLKDSQNSNSKPPQKMNGIKKRLTVHSTETSKRHNKRKDDDTDIVTDIPERKRRKILASNEKKKTPFGSQGHATASDSPARDGAADIHINCSETSVEVQRTDSETKTSQASGKSLRPRKSTWKNLVHGAVNTTFQISDIAADSSHDIEVQPGSDNLSERCFTGKDNLKSDTPETKEPKASAEDLLINADIVAEATKGTSWLQKSSIAASASHDMEVQLVPDNLCEPCLNVKDSSKNDLPQTKEPNAFAEASSSNSNVPADKATKGASWLQKSSWTQLVGDSNQSSFSISQIVPNATSEMYESQPPPMIDFSSSVNKKRQTHVRQIPESQRGTKTDGLASNANTSTNPSANGEANHQRVQQSNVETDFQMDKETEASKSSLGKKQPSASEPGGTDIDDTCTFMRSAASMKEWTKIKATLSGSLKKKSNQK